MQLRPKSLEQRHEILIKAAETVVQDTYLDKASAIRRHGSFDKYIESLREKLKTALQECYYCTNQDFTGTTVKID